MDNEENEVGAYEEEERVGREEKTSGRNTSALNTDRTDKLGLLAGLRASLLLAGLRALWIAIFSGSRDDLNTEFLVLGPPGSGKSVMLATLPFCAHHNIHENWRDSVIEVSRPTGCYNSHQTVLSAMFKGTLHTDKHSLGDSNEMGCVLAKVPKKRSWRSRNSNSVKILIRQPATTIYFPSDQKGNATLSTDKDQIKPMESNEDLVPTNIVLCWPVDHDRKASDLHVAAFVEFVKKWSNAVAAAKKKRTFTICITKYDLAFGECGARGYLEATNPDHAKRLVKEIISANSHLRNIVNEVRRCIEDKRSISAFYMPTSSYGFVPGNGIANVNGTGHIRTSCHQQSELGRKNDSLDPPSTSEYHYSLEQLLRIDSSGAVHPWQPFLTLDIFLDVAFPKRSQANALRFSLLDNIR